MITLLNMCMIRDGDRVLVLDKVEKNGWGGITFPGGHVEQGESIVDSVIREVREESGLEIFSPRLCGMVEWEHEHTHDRSIVFLFSVDRFQGELIGETHEGKVFWILENQLPQMKLAPNMLDYLKIFRDDSVNEAYSTYNDEVNGVFRHQ